MNDHSFVFASIDGLAISFFLARSRYPARRRWAGIPANPGSRRRPVTPQFRESPIGIDFQFCINPWLAVVCLIELAITSLFLFMSHFAPLSGNLLCASVHSAAQLFFLSPESYEEPFERTEMPSFSTIRRCA